MPYFCRAKSPRSLYNFHFQQHSFLLLPEKAIYWPARQCLIVADIHLGKVAHFRKAGLAVPQASAQADFTILQDVLQKYQPKHLLILGDLFHSHHNLAWEQFALFRRQYAACHFQLVEGNHDILKPEQYIALDIELLGPEFTFENLVFTHYPMKKPGPGLLNLCGHIHPGVRLSGKARQSMSFPCYYVQNNQMILPSFGQLTGLKILPAVKGATAYVILGSQISEVTFP